MKTKICISELETFQGNLISIIRLIEKTNLFKSDGKNVIKERLSSFKKSVSVREKELEKLKKLGKLSLVEEDFLLPAYSAIDADLSIPISTVQIQDWASHVWDCESTFSYWINELKKSIGEQPAFVLQEAK
jgi:hypothetical protein